MNIQCMNCEFDHRRKWWWNSGEKAWSTYLDKMDKEWVKSISERYEKYV